MFGHAGLAKARRRHQLARRPFSGAEQIEHLTAARLGNGFKRAHIIIFSYRNITVNAFIGSSSRRQRHERPVTKNAAL